MIRKSARCALLAALIAASLVVLPVRAAKADEAPPVFDLVWGSHGVSDGQFDSPNGVAVDSDGYVYVVDTTNNRIQKFTASGTFVTKWGFGLGSGYSQFNNPNGVAVDSDDNVYVADSGNHRIQKFTSTGTFVTTWGTTGTGGAGAAGDGQFNHPTGVAVDNTGNVYVADTLNHRIQKFTSTGTFVTKWGIQGTGDGQFNHPSGVAVDSTGNVYVVDALNHRIQKFTSTGTFVTKWGTNGTGDGQFSYPDGVAVDSTGNVYVVDTVNHRIQKFTSTGTFVTTWGTYGGGAYYGVDEFNYPHGVAIDGNGDVYVADTSNDRIQRFEYRSEATYPTVDLRTPAAEQAFLVGSAATADYSCDDAGGSGLATCVGTLADGASIDTSTLGEHQFTVSAADNAGNETVVSHTYRVVGLPAQNGRIAHTRQVSGVNTIFTMNVDGSDPVRLANNTRQNSLAAWSPDGTRIAFVQNDVVGNKIYTMWSDGTHVTRLTTLSSGELDPAWSPDGSRIAFSSGLTGNAEIFTVKADGSDPVQITNSPTTAETTPAWSPDGTRIAYTRTTGTNADILYVRLTDLPHLYYVAGSGATETSPDWSPDGTHIAFEANYLGNRDIFVESLVDLGTSQLTTGADDDRGPAWSPDGTRIAFHTNRDGNYEIYTMAADGTGQTRLTTNAAVDSSPAWQPVIDAAGPVVNVNTPADSATYGRGETVTADYGCTDTPAGVVTCEGTVPDGAAIDTSALGAHDFTVTATDNAGNSSTVTHSYSVVRTAEINGTVTETATTTPLEGTWVVALRASDFGLAGGALTGADGRYTLAVDPGSYYLEFVDPALSHVIEWYDGRGFDDLATADPVVATAGTPRTIDVDLTDPTGTITGTITDHTTGAPVAGAGVAVMRSGASQPLAAVTTDTAGNYRLGALEPATYVVVAATSTGTYHPGFHGDTDQIDEATPIAISPGTRADADITLSPATVDPPATTITGTVTDDVTNQPEPGALVGALRAADFGFTAATFTDADGHYSLGLPNGDYLLEFFDLDTGHHFEWYDNQLDPAAGAELTTVTAGGTADAAMTPLEGIVAGTITDQTTGDPVHGAWVAVMGYTDGQPVAGTTTDADGHYTLPAIDNGDYYLVFIDPTGSHALEFHDGTNGPNAATPVTVTGSHTTTIDATIAPTP